MFPHWRYADVLVWLARHYPRGLSFAGYDIIREEHLAAAIENEMEINSAYRKLVNETQERGETLLTPDYEEIEISEVADEAIEVVEEMITQIQEDNFENISTDNDHENHTSPESIPGVIIQEDKLI